MKIFKLLVSFIWLCTAHSERILFLAPACSKSHKVSFMPIVEALAEKGHYVTVVTPFKSSTVHSNVYEIAVDNLLDKISFSHFDLHQGNLISKFPRMWKLMKFFMYEAYIYLMQDEVFKSILKSPNYDLVIVNGIAHDYILPIIDTWNIPRVAYLPSSGVTSNLVPLGISREYASIPAGMVEYDDQMTFFQRLNNMLITEFTLLIRQYFVLPKIDELVQKDFPNARPVAEIEKDDVLVLMSHNLATAWPRPLNPNVIPVGGLHLRPGKPLPEDLKTFADGADHGLIIFTLGSITKGSAIPNETTEIFLKVFSKLPQRVVWKWETDLADVPSNIKLLDWLPQQDLLEHANTRLFISHGGLGGTQESLYSSVPMLGIPFSIDQSTNVVRAVKEGWALKLNWDNITEANLEDSITRLITQPSFQGNATRLSRLLRDEMMPARDVAVYWIEHVIRHGGSKHLQVSSKNMPLHKYLLLDVLAFLFFIASVALLINSLILRWFFQRIMRSSKTKSD